MFFGGTSRLGVTWRIVVGFLVLDLNLFTVNFVVALGIVVAFSVVNIDLFSVNFVVVSVTLS